MRTTGIRPGHAATALAALTFMMCIPALVDAVPVVDPEGNAYEWVSEIHSWDEAASLATSMFWTDSHGMVHQGYLATITSAAENAFIVANVIPANASGWGWLGGHLSTGWLTDESFAYRNWCETPLEPSGDGDCIDVMTINVSSQNVGKWNDERCELALPFIVEYGPLRAVSTEVVTWGAMRAMYR